MRKVVPKKRTVTALAQTLTVSSQDDSSDVSDLEKFDEAYTDFGALTKNVDPRTLERDGSANQNEEVPGINLPGGMKALHSLANVPKSWPLARLTIPLSAASKHLERLLEGCCENHVRELRTFFTLSQSHASRVLLL